MCCRDGVVRAGVLACLALAWAWGPSSARAQIATQSPAGIVIDADGVLHKQIFTDPTGELTQQRIAAARSTLGPQVAEPSKLRKISLNRLERALAKLLDNDAPPTAEMLHLAGLTRLKYVFYYPDTHDVVLAGPAEGWMEDLAGRHRGLYSGRPVLELADLAVAMRAYPASGQDGPVIGCSIDPTPEGLARMQGFLANVGATVGPNDADFIVEGLRSNLGLQQVRILGVSPRTHFAQVLVEADYRMKLIGIGLERPPVRLASYVDKANPAEVGRNSLQRWYFTPDYDCVKMSDDGLAMELVGEGVKLIGEDEVVTGEGQRRKAARGNRASQHFVAEFTRKYPALADKEPVYAQLRNLIDMTIAAAYLQHEGLYAQAEWTPAVLTDETRFAVETQTTPVQVETVVTAVWKGPRLMTPLGGGVNVQAELALDPARVLADEGGALAKSRDAVKIELADGQWWWD